MPWLYLETNFLMGVATGRLPQVAALRAEAPQGVRFAMPAVCVMEALTAAQQETRRDRRFSRQLDEQRQRHRKSQSAYWTEVGELVSSLVTAQLRLTTLMNDRRNRLYQAIRELDQIVEWIPVSSSALTGAMDASRTRQPTDNLIVHLIADHGRKQKDQSKAFFTENIRDFLQEQSKALLDAAGIQPLLGRMEDVRGWFHSLPGSLPPS